MWPCECAHTCGLRKEGCDGWVRVVLRMRRGQGKEWERGRGGLKAAPLHKTSLGVGALRSSGWLAQPSKWEMYVRVCAC